MDFFLGMGHLSPSGERVSPPHAPSPYTLGACGVSILAPSALDLAPPNPNPDSGHVLWCCFSADFDMCATFWTAGQRAKLNRPNMSMVPLVWKLKPYVWQTMFRYKNWSMSGPSASGNCVHVTSTGRQPTTPGATPGSWECSSCDSLRCVVCELPLSHVDWCCPLSAHDIIVL